MNLVILNSRLLRDDADVNKRYVGLCVCIDMFVEHHWFSKFSIINIIDSRNVLLSMFLINCTRDTCNMNVSKIQVTNLFLTSFFTKFDLSVMFDKVFNEWETGTGVNILDSFTKYNVFLKNFWCWETECLIKSSINKRHVYWRYRYR